MHFNISTPNESVWAEEEEEEEAGQGRERSGVLWWFFQVVVIKKKTLHLNKTYGRIFLFLTLKDSFLTYLTVLYHPLQGLCQAKRWLTEFRWV